MEKALLTVASRTTEALLNGASHREDGKRALLSSSPHPPALSAAASPPVLTSSASSSPHPPVLSASSSPVPVTSRSLALLRDVRTRNAS